MKESLRRKIKNILRDFSKLEINQQSDIITQKLINQTDKFNTRFIYLSTEQEIQTSKLIENLHKQGKTVLVPLIIKDEMIPVIYDINSELEIWTFWIKTIKNPTIYKWEIDVAIIPWIAFDKKWWRLGRWWWYFDKFLTKNKEIYKIWICFSQQIVENIQLEEHDIIMDEIIH